MKVVTLGLTAVLLTTGLFCEAQTMAARLDAAIDSAITSHRIVGAVVVVLRDGKVVYRRAAGLADREAATPYADGAPPIRMGDIHLLPLPDGRGISYSPGRAFDPHSFPSGGGGMNGTAEDVARLLEVVRTGGGKILKPATAHAMLINQTGSLPIIFGPGWGFGFGGALLTDPKAAKTPQSLGTWSWGGAWGHSWFVDPMSRLVVVALTNTAVEGMSGKFPTDVRDAVYGKK